MFREFSSGKDVLNTFGWPQIVYFALSELQVADMGDGFAGELVGRGYERQPVPLPASDRGALVFQDAAFDTRNNMGWPEVRSAGAFTGRVGGVAICAWDLERERDMSMTATVLKVGATYQR